MPVAIRAITRLQDADDVNVSLGVGVDEYALCWDNDTARFVLRAVAAGVTDHGALTGLADDDHAGYALLAGRAGGQTIYGGTAANDDITIQGTSNATRTTSYVILQPTAGNVGIGTTAPEYLLHLYKANGTADFRVEQAGAGNYRAGITTIADGSAITYASYADGYTVVAAYAGKGVMQTTGGSLVLATWEAGYDLEFYAGQRVTPNAILKDGGRFGIGTTAPSTLLHGLLTSSATNAVTNVLTIGHDTSGTAAAGFGAGLLFKLESSTTAAQDAARVAALWYEATHATRKADLVLTAYDTAEREGLRIRGNGSAPAIGFLGAAPAARIAHVADPSGGATVDAEARSAINSILATLENFGFHAIS